MNNGVSFAFACVFLFSALLISCKDGTSVISDMDGDLAPDGDQWDADRDDPSEAPEREEASLDGDSIEFVDGDQAEAELETEMEKEGDEDAELERETFPPDKQTPLFRKGMILPPNSLECTPVDTGIPIKNCNHHGSTIAELPDGRVAVVWYHGQAEKSPDSRIVWSIYNPPEDSWSPVEVIYDDPDLSDGNVAIWVDEGGDIFLFFSTIMIGSWDDANIRMIRSSDDGLNWSDYLTLREEYCWNARHRPQRLANGDLLLPLYHECLALPVFIRSSDNFQTWSEDEYEAGPYFLDHLGQIQPALIRLAGGRVSAITRDGTHAKRIKRMISDDHGMSWTTSQPLGLPNSGTSVDHVRLLDGHVVVVFNNSPDHRFPLSVALSLDEGETYTAIRDVNAECPEGGCSYHYPSIMQSRHDGTIWISYTHKRETIGWIQFNEAWLMEGGETANIHCLPTFTCQDTFCFPECSKEEDCGDGESCRESACRKACDAGTSCSEDEICQDGFCIPKVDTERVDVHCSLDER